ncbi:hypothetical protein [Alkaliphilus serpentinus]|uniref:Uncharacterized protein n=1 Tax=Alkaliphilus serpentinus TaxID=1482731 RepID=A0A833HRT9_9FIRM|nr:hypothetical protein [Alkaliphilus serpentinus]KAB3533561.1 hypothetical protein F8153_00475 [Alkaliphilus serpentinus]
MFFKRQQKNINLDEKIIKKSKVPILIHDIAWRQIFKKNMNRTMEGLSKELDNLLKEEKETQKKIQERNNRKNTVIKLILKISELINSKGREDAIEELEKAKDEMQQLNTELEELYQRLESFPFEIERVNLALLKETVRVAYTDLNKSKDQLAATEGEISKLRMKLDVLREEKEELTNKVDSLYTFLHAMVGHEEMENIDEQLENKEDNK